MTKQLSTIWNRDIPPHIDLHSKIVHHFLNLSHFIPMISIDPFWKKAALSGGGTPQPEARAKKTRQKFRENWDSKWWFDGALIFVG